MVPQFKSSDGNRFLISRWLAVRSKGTAALSLSLLASMSKELDAKLKTALDESRLLILGAQVLFGFAFQAAFQELFAEVDVAGRTMQILALGLLSLSVALLIVPSLYHQIACRGRTLHKALGVATLFAGWSLLPLTLGLGASAYVVFARFAGNEIGLVFAGLLTATGLSLLYGLGFSLRKKAESSAAGERDFAQNEDRAASDRSTRHHPGRPGTSGFSVRGNADEGVRELAGRD